MNAKAVSRLSTDTETIHALIRGALDALQADKIDDYFSYFADDALWMTPSSFRDVTLAEARSFYGFTEKFRFEQASNVNEVTVADDLAYARISLDGYLRPKADINAAPLRSISRRIWIFRRQRDGDWRIIRDIWNNPTSTRE